MSDEIKSFTSSQGQPEFERAIEFMDAFRGICAAMMNDSDPQDLAIAQSAACMFAGTIFGSMIIGGLAHEGDKRRAGEVMLHAFREGIKVGKTRAMRVMQPAGSA